MQSPGVLVIHNRYQQPAGEDAAVRAEVDLLRSAGHRVVQYTRDNSDLTHYSSRQKGALLFTTTWSRRTYDDIRRLIRQERPDIAHCHNFLPLVSPSALYACRSEGIPVVQTLHNYRLLCPAATLFANGRRCERCPCRALSAARRRCYRNSWPQTATVSLMLAAHRLARTWTRCVDAYIAPSRFCRDYFVLAGLPEQKVHVKPNFLARDPGQRSGQGGYALFVGRLSPEKGALEMLEAWSQLPEVSLRVIGDGPLYFAAQRLACHRGDVRMLGQMSTERTLAHIRSARFLVFPSRWYEPFGMGLLEAAACGVPAIASRIGAIPELVIEGRTGLLFDPDNFDDFAQRIRWAWTHPREMHEMGRAARQLYLQRFTAERNYRILMDIYGSLLAN
ncbi:MAG TPA: glycosyltransferase family 4 protein [Candidatus Binatia bacterium]|nr:glycosyltransferase family 4 protein [Candidatus Binatia bacterium]